MDRVSIAFKIGFHFIVGLLLILFLPFIWSITLHLIGEVTVQHLWLPISVGVLPGILLAQLSRRDGNWYGTFEHEMTHAVAMLLTGTIPTSITVHSGEGGLAKGIGCLPMPFAAFAIDFITLAPYILPTTTVFVVLLRPLIAPHGGWFDVLIGMTFAFHCLTTFWELQRSWKSGQNVNVEGNLMNTDIAKTGFIFSAIYIPVVTLAIHSFLLAIIVHGYVGVPHWGVAVWRPFWSSAVHWWHSALAVF